MPLLDRIANGVLTLLGILLIATVTLSVYNVVSRYVFNSALLWADEIAVFAMIVIAWLGAVVCGWKSAEIKMDIFVEALPERLRLVVNLTHQALMAVLCLWIAWQAVPYIGRAYAVGMRADASGTPLWLIHAVIPLSFLMIAVIAAVRFALLCAGQKPASDRTQTDSEQVQ